MIRYVIPEGKIVRGWTIRLRPTDVQRTQFQRDCGGRRYAYNWAVGEIKQAFTQGRSTGDYDKAVWSAFTLRKRWNSVKSTIAPWWSECSKEAFSTGIKDASSALHNWQDARKSHRKGVGFPRFKKKTRDRLRCRYTTGALRIEGVREIVLPGVGQVITEENIRPIWRHVRRGTGKLLSVTIHEKAGRWYVSLRVEITKRHQLQARTDTVGVDLGIGNNLLVVVRPDGSVVEKVANPRALRSAQTVIRRLNRSLSRKTRGSLGWQRDKQRLARVHERVVNIRNDTLHKATTRLTKSHGQIVIEDLQPAQHQRGLRSHRKSWIDASAGELRRQFTYKSDWYGSTLWIADRWYPSSKTCADCKFVHDGLTLSDRTWVCPNCGVVHDRDENAGTNLARLPASLAETRSDCKTVLVRQIAVKRVKHLRKVA